MTKTNKLDLLVVVHPGSLCGSLWTSGLSDCGRITANIIAEIRGWTGPRVAVYGELEDELDDYREIGDAVAEIEEIVIGSPQGNGLARAAEEILTLHPAGTLGRIVVTGAWADPSDGCVTCVAEALQKLAPKVHVEISPNAPVYP